MDIHLEKQTKLAIPRQEYKVVVHFEESTPKRTDIRKEVAQKGKVDEKLVVIKSINVDYGTKEARTIAYVYDNEQAMKDIEYQKTIDKNEGKAAAPAAK